MTGAVLLAALGSSAPAAAADSTPPEIRATIFSTLGDNGWFVADVTVSWQVQDPESGIKSTQGCDVRTLESDTVLTNVTCAAENRIGLRSSTTVPIRLDATRPVVTGAVPAREPDANGWYNHAVAFGFVGSDATSGIDHCSVVRYSGPESANGNVRGRCTDKAGNVGPAGSFPVKFDATAPKVRAAFGRLPDRYGWYGRRVRIRFAGRDEVSGIANCRGSGIYRGPNSRNARRRGSCTDRAGNKRARRVTFRFQHPLLSPKAGSRLTGRPRLEWIDVPRARFYNVQLWRSGKVLSRWPNGTEFRVPRNWSYQGVRYALAPGRYTWYVWPRFGDRYGRVIGRSSFVKRRG